jgi:hypothetical protein
MPIRGRLRNGAKITLEKAIDQIRKSAVAERAIPKPEANDIHPADPGEVGNHIIEPDIAEYEPRIAFVGHPTIGLQAKPGILQDLGRTIEMQEFGLRPAVPMASGIG